jgi:RimJ/RimL family protein N-acetyltransferase
MRTDNMLVGERVRLVAFTQADIPVMARWYQDAGFLRLYDATPAFPKTEEEIKETLEELRKNKNEFAFGVRLLETDELIGDVQLGSVLWAHGVAWLSLGIGVREYWGQGYGEEIARLALNFGFTELNLHRIQLTVFGYNERAVRLYERLGFQREGVYREFMQRDGQRFDMYLYGLLRREWEAGQQMSADKRMD